MARHGSSQAGELASSCIELTKSIIDIGRAVTDFPGQATDEDDAQTSPHRIEKLFEAIPAVLGLLETAKRALGLGKITEATSEKAERILQQCQDTLHILRDILTSACPKVEHGIGRRVGRDRFTVSSRKLLSILEAVQDSLLLLEDQKVFVIDGKLCKMQELVKDWKDEDGYQERGSSAQFVSANSGSMRNYIQEGPNNTQINTENYNDHRSTIGRQYVHGPVQLKHARIQQITQNSFSGPISIRANTIASNSSRLTVFPAAASLVRSANRLHRTFIKCNALEDSSESTSAFLLFRKQLQQIQDALKPGQNNEHRLDLISFQDYFLVLVQAFQLFTDIDQNIADLDLVRDGAHFTHETLLEHFHITGVDELNEQLKHQCEVLTSATYTAAQQSASKVIELGDQHAMHYSRDLADIDKRIRHAQKLLSSMTNQLPQLEKMALDGQDVSAADAAAQAEWERELLDSPAYSRALQLAVSDRFSISTSQSSARSEAWPSLDLISLAHISIISVVGLPVVWESLSTFQRDDLGSIMEEAELQDDRSSSHTLLPEPSRNTKQTLPKKRDRNPYELTFVQRVLVQTSGLRALAGRQDMWRALVTGDEAGFQALLSQGVSPAFRDRKTHTTPLQEAARMGKPAFIDMILRGAPFPEAIDYVRAIDLAIWDNRIESLQAFLPHGLMITASMEGQRHSPLGLAATLDRWQMIKLLLTVSGAEINHLSCGKTPLILAIEHDSLHTVEILLADQRVHVDAGLGVSGKSPIALAIEHENLRIVEMLLAEDRVHVNADTGLGSPLIEAIYLGHTDIAQAMIFSGRMKLHQLNALSGTALSEAFARKNDIIARLILETDPSTLRSATLAVFDHKIEDLTSYAQNLVCDYVASDSEFFLFRSAVMSKNVSMVVNLLRHPVFNSGFVVQRRLEHAMVTGDLPLVCTLRNYIWNNKVPLGGHSRISIWSLTTAVMNGHLKVVLEVLKAVDRTPPGAPQEYQTHNVFIVCLDDIEDLIRANGNAAAVKFYIQRLSQHLTQSDPVLNLRTMSGKVGLANREAPKHWSELPARTLLTQ